MSDAVFLPDGWTVAALSQCADVLDSRRKPVNSKERSERPGPIPYYGATGQVGWIDDYLFDEELVLLGEDGAPFHDKSKHIAYIIHGKSWVNNHAHVLRARPHITSNGYLKHYLDSFDFTDFVGGSTRDKLTQTAMNSILVPLAPRPVQDALVSLMDAIAEKQAEALGHVWTAFRAIEGFKRAVLETACSGRLTADWYGVPAGSPFRAVTPLIDAPERWPWATLGEIAEIQGGIQVGSKQKPGEPLRQVPYLRVANVQRGWLDLDEVKNIAAAESTIAKLKLHPGDIFFNEGGDRDKLGRGWIWEGQIEECIHQNHVFRARLHDLAMQPRFFSWYGNTFGMLYFFDEGKQTVNLASLSKTKLSQLPVPVPGTDEQAEIVRRVEILLNIADRIKSEIEATKRKVENTPQSVLAKVFRGDLPVADKVTR